jgi:hypothetical protein
MEQDTSESKIPLSFQIGFIAIILIAGVIFVIFLSEKPQPVVREVPSDETTTPTNPPSDTHITPSTNCKSDINCILGYSSTCKPSFLIFEQNASLESFPETKLVGPHLISYTIKGRENGKCLLEIENMGYSVYYPSEEFSRLRSLGFSEQEISSNVNTLNSILNQGIGKKAECKFADTADLTLFFINSKEQVTGLNCTYLIENNVTHVSCSPIKGATCSGTLLNYTLNESLPILNSNITQNQSNITPSSFSQINGTINLSGINYNDTLVTTLSSLSYLLIAYFSGEDVPEINTYISAPDNEGNFIVYSDQRFGFDVLLVIPKISQPIDPYQINEVIGAAIIPQNSSYVVVDEQSTATALLFSVPLIQTGDPQTDTLIYNQIPNLECLPNLIAEINKSDFSFNITYDYSKELTNLSVTIHQCVLELDEFIEENIPCDLQAIPNNISIRILGRTKDINSTSNYPVQWKSSYEPIATLARSFAITNQVTGVSVGYTKIVLYDALASCYAYADVTVGPAGV